MPSYKIKKLPKHHYKVIGLNVLNYFRNITEMQKSYMFSLLIITVPIVLFLIVANLILG